MTEPGQLPRFEAAVAALLLIDLQREIVALDAAPTPDHDGRVERQASGHRHALTGRACGPRSRRSWSRLHSSAGGSGELASALVTVVLFPGERVDALRQVLGLSPSGVVRGVDRLVAAGLVERRGGSGDAREVLLDPTRRGVRVAERILAARARVVDELLRGLTGRERADLVRLFEKLLTALPSDREAARRICRLCDHPACERSRCPVSEGAPGERHRSHPAGGFGRSR